MTKEAKQQFTLRISRANSTELVVILYEMALQFLEEAEDAYDTGDITQYKEAIRKVRGCINELIQSLHMEYEPAPKLLRLYLYCIRRLAYAEVRKEPGVLEEIRKILTKLGEAYATISPANTSAPVMSNTQSVISGLTYGRGAALTEDMTGQDSNRGMFV